MNSIPLVVSGGSLAGIQSSDIVLLLLSCLLTGVEKEISPALSPSLTISLAPATAGTLAYS